MPERQPPAARVGGDPGGVERLERGPLEARRQRPDRDPGGTAEQLARQARPARDARVALLEPALAGAVAGGLAAHRAEPPDAGGDRPPAGTRPPTPPLRHARRTRSRRRRRPPRSHRAPPTPSGERARSRCRRPQRAELERGPGGEVPARAVVAGDERRLRRLALDLAGEQAARSPGAVAKKSSRRVAGSRQSESTNRSHRSPRPRLRGCGRGRRTRRRRRERRGSVRPLRSRAR